MDAPRYKTYPSGRKVKLCSGLDNTCTSEAKKDGTCIGCKTGRKQTDFDNRQEGEVFIASGCRQKRAGGQNRKLCIGDNDTCMSFRKHGDLCDGHHSGFKKYGTDDLKKGDIVERNGELRIYDGYQLRQFCSAPDCKQITVIGGECKSHAASWKCKFTGHACKRIRTYGDYCALHRDNIQHLKEKSKGETKVAGILTDMDIKFQCNSPMKCNGKILYPDFLLTEHNVVIEFDGVQHFQAVERWGGEEGLKGRQQNDLTKEHWCLENKILLLRISYADMNRVEELIKTFMDIVPTLDRESDSLLWSSDHLCFENKYDHVNVPQLCDE